jgi:hypothetical protein
VPGLQRADGGELLLQGVEGDVHPGDALEAAVPEDGLDQRGDQHLLAAEGVEEGR